MKNKIIRVDVSVHYFPYPDYSIKVWRDTNDGNLVSREYTWADENYGMKDDNGAFDFTVNHRVEFIEFIQKLSSPKTLIPASVYVSSISARYALATNPKAWEY